MEPEKILESLTPGGSEFIGDPKFCGDFIRKRMRDMHASIKNQVKKRKRCEKRITELEEELEVTKEMLAIECAVKTSMAGHMEKWGKRVVGLEKVCKSAKEQIKAKNKRIAELEALIKIERK